MKKCIILFLDHCLTFVVLNSMIHFITFINYHKSFISDSLFIYFSFFNADTFSSNTLLIKITKFQHFVNSTKILIITRLINISHTRNKGFVVTSYSFASFHIRLEKVWWMAFVMPWGRSCQIWDPLKEIVSMLEVAANFCSETRDFVFSKRVIVFLFLKNVVHYRGMKNIQKLIYFSYKTFMFFTGIEHSLDISRSLAKLKT